MENLIFGFLIPLIGTTLGAFLIFFIKGQLSERKIKLIQGFAAGVMMAASIWSLILPALELSGDNPYTCYIPTTIGFVLGMNFLMLFDWFYSKRKNIDMMNLAVVIHNIPEGLSVGVAFAAVMVQSPLALTSAYALSFGIGIQNIPEGSIISLNLLAKKGKWRSFLAGFLSGIVEPIASILAFLLIYYVQPVMPYFLSFAAGAMIYVVVNELIPNCKSKIGNVGVCLGFCIMMILDVMLG